MRLSVRRVLQWVIALVLVQVVVYYYSAKRPRRIITKLTLPRYVQSPDSADGTCSFKTCPQVKEGLLNVHIVPHSHIDVGWLKTVDQYYTGEVPMNIGSVELGCVRCTLESTIRELEKNPDRRFVFIEMKYLSRYWNEVNGTERELIRKLIQERRLELVGGGWVMSDAGVTFYNDIIDQHTLGFDFIADTFGPCAQSRTAWHVDQFGHSREHASIFAQMGYDSLFVSRIDFEDLAERKRTQNMEFIWHTSPNNLKNRSTLFTQVTYDGYYAPPGFVLDSNSQASQQVSELDAIHFIKIIKQRALSYKGKHILVPMGSDFGYKNAETWFRYLDPLIKKANEVGGSGFEINFVYSTPSCYTYYVNKDKLTLEVKKDDFLPYSVPPSAFWTGYYTTRGGFKRFVKLAGQILQSCKQLSIFTELEDSFPHVNVLRDAMGVMQHHDGVTGTQKKHVLKDYSLVLSNATQACQSVMAQAYRKLWEISDSDTSLVTPQFCPDLNISSCPVTEGSNQFLVTVYNTLSWTLTVDVRFPVKYKQLTVRDWTGEEVPYQIVPIHEHIKRIPERSSTADAELVMLTSLPPMSVSTFSVQPTAGEAAIAQYQKTIENQKLFVIENEHLSVKFDTDSGLLVSITNKDSSVTESISQDFNYYEAQQDVHRFSGAYVFIPKHPATIRVAGEQKVMVRIVKGPLVQEVHQTFSPWVSQVIRLYKGAKHVEFQWTVGPIDDSDHQGKEVISVFTSSIANSDTFYTDSNGREMMERVKDVRDTWNYQPKDHVSGNYYPIASRIVIKDPEKNVQLTVLPDRPQGGSSLGSGVVELMVHRKLMNDDGLGVGEALNDVGIDNRGVVFTGKHYVVLDTIENSAPLVKRLSLQLHLAPTVMFTPVAGDVSVKTALKQEQFLTNELPPNVHVLTLDRISSNETSLFLLRLEHVFEENEHPLLSLPVEVSLETLFKPFDIVSAAETTLGGNFNPSDIKRLRWKAFNDVTEESISSPDYKLTMYPPFTIKLSPMEIRTFHIQTARND